MNIPYHNKALPKGAILREWTLEEVVGVGGFGIVYRAKGIYFGEEVAIKEYFPGAISDRQDGTTVTPTDSSSEEVYTLGLQKFLEEAKVLWSLSKPERHPNIVNVRSLFEIHGTAYMVMDFERGISLSQMLKDGRKFDEASLTALFKPIAEGLDRAHRAGVLHRDIKPANILVDETGRPVLIDFGSARFESGQATNTKVTFYTPPYAAIEQYVKTYPQGAWTDIYALGVVLYQCVTGEKPSEVLERMHGEQNQLLSEREWPGFGSAFTRAVDAAMGIRPIERPQSISAWLKMFEAKDAAQADDVTRTAEFPAPTMAAAPLAVATAPIAVPAPGENSIIGTGLIPLPLTRPLGRDWFLWTGAASVILVAAGLAILFLSNSRQAAPMPAAAPVAASAPLFERVKSGTQTSAEEADDLLMEAQKLGRPQREITALADSKDKIEALAGQIHGFGPAPDRAAKAAALTIQINSLAAGMSHDEVNALARASKLLLRDIGQPAGETVPADAVAATTAVSQAKGKLDDAVSAALQAQDAIPALNEARQVLTAYAAFTTAYSAAAQVYISVRRNDIAAVDQAAHVISDKLSALGKVSPPWFLASRARKQAYQQLVDNAAQGATQVAQLDALAQTTAKLKDLKQMNAVLTQVKNTKVGLDDLLAKSNAAVTIYSQ